MSNKVTKFLHGLLNTKKVVTKVETVPEEEEMVFETNPRKRYQVTEELSVLPDGSARVPGCSAYYATPNGAVYYVIQRPETLEVVYKRCHEFVRPGNTKAYVDIQLRRDRDGCIGRYRLPRILAATFIDRSFNMRYIPGNMLYVTYLDGDENNNCIENLSIDTAVANKKHAREALDKQIGHVPVPVELVDIKTGAVVKQYPSIVEMMADLDIHNGGEIDAFLKKHFKYKKQYYIEYTDPTLKATTLANAIKLKRAFNDKAKAKYAAKQAQKEVK